jgi:hypothetical protein
MKDKLIRDTARAWQLEYHQVRGMFRWLDKNISPEYRSQVLSKLLRERYNRVVRNNEKQ